VTNDTILCARLGIKHYLNNPAHPESNGRCGRSHRTDDEEFYRPNPVNHPRQQQYLLPNWQRFYNYQRTHMALNDLTPYQAWLNYKNQSEEINKAVHMYYLGPQLLVRHAFYPAQNQSRDKITPP